MGHSGGPDLRLKQDTNAIADAANAAEPCGHIDWQIRAHITRAGNAALCKLRSAEPHVRSAVAAKDANTTGQCRNN